MNNRFQALERGEGQGEKCVGEKKDYKEEGGLFASSQQGDTKGKMLPRKKIYIYDCQKRESLRHASNCNHMSETRNLKCYQLIKLFYRKCIQDTYCRIYF